jgi:hypothetical protein
MIPVHVLHLSNDQIVVFSNNGNWIRWSPT